MLEPVEQQYVRIGEINRAHGIRGELLLIPDFYAPALFEQIDLAYIQNARGDLVPARVESARVQEKNNRLSFFVKFEHISDRTGAGELKNCPVYAERSSVGGLVEEAEAPGESYSSFSVIDGKGNTIGTVEGVIENPAHPILQIRTEQGEQLLVPLVDEYVASADEEQQTITCRNLDQLSDLLS